MRLTSVIYLIILCTIGTCLVVALIHVGDPSEASSLEYNCDNLAWLAVVGLQDSYVSRAAGYDTMAEFERAQSRQAADAGCAGVLKAMAEGKLYLDMAYDSALSPEVRSAAALRFQLLKEVLREGVTHDGETF